ncbi:MAG TPA: Uma2 family endonuclease [Candidatus Elarobacter sp.]|jgi:Uma2 family endonuclease|nr:Uma2 family endonuclease [Candidatus Elarobacter sp.]
MVETEIPRWLAALDEEKPYIEVLDGEKLPDVSPYKAHGQLAVRIGAQLDAWAGDRGGVGVEVRFYFQRADGRWSSLLPDVDYMSYARVPNSMGDSWQRPRVAPDIAFEILSPSDRPGRTQRKVETYLEFGATLVVVLHPIKRRVWLHRQGGSVEERAARGTWALAPFDDLVIDWERVYRNIG